MERARPFIILTVLLLILGGVGAGIYFYSKRTPTESAATPQERSGVALNQINQVLGITLNASNVTSNEEQISMSEISLRSEMSGLDFLKISSASFNNPGGDLSNPNNVVLYSPELTIDKIGIQFSAGEFFTSASLDNLLRKALSAASVRIQNGSVNFVYLNQMVRNINLELRTTSAASNILEFSGSFEFRGYNFTISGRANLNNSPAAITVSLSYIGGNDEFGASFNLDFRGNTPNIIGENVRLISENFKTFIDSFLNTSFLPTETFSQRGQLDVPLFVLGGEFPDKFILNDINVIMGDATITGTIVMPSIESEPTQLTLNVERLRFANMMAFLRAYDNASQPLDFKITGRDITVNSTILDEIDWQGSLKNGELNLTKFIAKSSASSINLSGSQNLGTNNLNIKANITTTNPGEISDVLNLPTEIDSKYIVSLKSFDGEISRRGNDFSLTNFTLNRDSENISGSLIINPASYDIKITKAKTFNFNTYFNRSFPMPNLYDVSLIVSTFFNPLKSFATSSGHIEINADEFISGGRPYRNFKINGDINPGNIKLTNLSFEHDQLNPKTFANLKFSGEITGLDGNNPGFKNFQAEATNNGFKTFPYLAINFPFYERFLSKVDILSIGTLLNSSGSEFFADIGYHYKDPSGAEAVVQSRGTFPLTRLTGDLSSMNDITIPNLNLFLEMLDVESDGLYKKAELLFKLKALIKDSSASFSHTSELSDVEIMLDQSILTGKLTLQDNTLSGELTSEDLNLNSSYEVLKNAFSYLRKGIIYDLSLKAQKVTFKDHVFTDVKMKFNSEKNTVIDFKSNELSFTMTKFSLGYKIDAEIKKMRFLAPLFNLPRFDILATDIKGSIDFTIDGFDDELNLINPSSEFNLELNDGVTSAFSIRYIVDKLLELMKAKGRRTHHNEVSDVITIGINSNPDPFIPFQKINLEGEYQNGVLTIKKGVLYDNGGVGNATVERLTYSKTSGLNGRILLHLPSLAPNIRAQTFPIEPKSDQNSIATIRVVTPKEVGDYARFLTNPSNADNIVNAINSGEATFPPLVPLFAETQPKTNEQKDATSEEETDEDKDKKPAKPVQDDHSVLEEDDNFSLTSDDDDDEEGSSADNITYDDVSDLIMRSGDEESTLLDSRPSKNSSTTKPYVGEIFRNDSLFSEYDFYVKKTD